jgi:hypothetical protein
VVHRLDQRGLDVCDPGCPGGRGIARGRTCARPAAGGPDPGQQGPSPQGAAAWFGGPVGDQGAVRVRPHPLSRQNIPVAEQLYLEYTTEQQE